MHSYLKIKRKFETKDDETSQEIWRNSKILLPQPDRICFISFRVVQEIDTKDEKGLLEKIHELTHF